MKTPAIKIELPDWIETFVKADRYASDEEKMSLAIGLAIENVRRENGGPFGAAIFEADSGRLVSVGVNQVTKLNNSCLHAETTAIMAAQAALETHNLNAAGTTGYELFTSCEPCAMCLGAILWSGVGRVVCAATKTDAARVGFDEGPVYESSYEYLEQRGIATRRGLLRDEAVRAFDLYLETGGVIYNR